MTPLIGQDGPGAQGCVREWLPAGTLIRRYALALTPAGAGIEAAVAAASVPPLSGGTGSHGSEAAHAFTIVGASAEEADGRPAVPKVPTPPS